MPDLIDAVAEAMCDSEELTSRVHSADECPCTPLARFAVAAVRQHLLTVVTDNARAGNDTLLGALLDAIREMEAPDA